MFFELFEEFDLRCYFLRYVVDNIVFFVVVWFIGDVEISLEVRIVLKGEFCFEEIVEEFIVIVIIKLYD